MPGACDRGSAYQASGAGEISPLGPAHGPALLFADPLCQSGEADPEKRKALVWQIERILAEDGARPSIFFDRRATCWRPQVKGSTIMVNSIFNGARMEDVWLDR